MKTENSWSINYFQKMIEIHGNNSKKVHYSILNNLVNSQYGRTSNATILEVWAEFNKYFKS